MGKTILLIHGRHFKPAKAPLEKLWTEALRWGVERDHPDKRIYNLAVRDGKSNPHHESGYLLHPYVAGVVGKWL